MTITLDDIKYGEVRVSDDEFYDYIVDKSINDSGRYCIYTNFPEKYSTKVIRAFSNVEEVRASRSNYLYIMGDISSDTDKIIDITSGLLATVSLPHEQYTYQILINRVCS